MSKNTLFSRAWKFLPVAAAAATAFTLLTTPMQQAKADDSISTAPVASYTVEEVKEGVTNFFDSILGVKEEKPKVEIEVPITTPTIKIEEKSIMDTSCYDALDQNLQGTSYEGIYKNQGRYEKPTVELCKTINLEISALRASNDKADITPIINKFFNFRPEFKILAQPIGKVTTQDLAAPTTPAIASHPTPPTLTNVAITGVKPKTLEHTFVPISEEGPVLQTLHSQNSIKDLRLTFIDTLPKFQLNFYVNSFFGPTIERADALFPKIVETKLVEDVVNPEIEKPTGISETIRIEREHVASKPIQAPTRVDVSEREDLSKGEKDSLILSSLAVPIKPGFIAPKNDVEQPKARFIIPEDSDLSGIFAYLCKPENYEKFLEANRLNDSLVGNYRSFLASNALTDSLPLNPDFQTKLGIEEIIKKMNSFTNVFQSGGTELEIPQSCDNGDIEIAKSQDYIIRGRLESLSKSYTVKRGEAADIAASELGLNSSQTTEFFKQIESQIKSRNSKLVFLGEKLTFTEYRLGSDEVEKDYSDFDSKVVNLPTTTDEDDIRDYEKALVIASSTNLDKSESFFEDSSLLDYAKMIGALFLFSLVELGAGSYSRRQISESVKETYQAFKNWKFAGSDERENQLRPELMFEGRKLYGVKRDTIKESKTGGLEDTISKPVPTSPDVNSTNPKKHRQKARKPDVDSSQLSLDLADSSNPLPKANNNGNNLEGRLGTTSQGIPHDVIGNDDYLTPEIIYSIANRSFEGRGSTRRMLEKMDEEKLNLYVQDQIRTFVDIKREYGLQLATVYLSLPKRSQDSSKLTQETFPSFIEKAQQSRVAHKRLMGLNRLPSLYDTMEVTVDRGREVIGDRIFPEGSYKPLNK